MSKKVTVKPSVNKPIVIVDPTECPFREYRDNELQPEFWGLGPAAFRAYSTVAKGVVIPKPSPDHVWADDQTQPLPRSVRQYLNGYERAEDLAMSRWESELVVFEENESSNMSIADYQLSHAQVLNRSSFCRNVLSACFILERSENVLVEHQWEGFSCALGPEGWRAKCHIYSPGTKPGGGVQHKPGLSKNGCYLVRLFYLGAWRCVWVSDQVPVDASGAPLLPFSPLLSRIPVATKTAPKAVPAATVTAKTVHLWPLLICKALLKLAAPDMNDNENLECVEDEEMPEFNIMHALTGAMVMTHPFIDDEQAWDLINSEVPAFSWDDDDDTQASTVRTKSTKKPTTKDTVTMKGKRPSIIYIIIEETKNYPPYHLPGITPGFEMSLMITMTRDVPLKKPLPEPEVEPWKYYRWVDWARGHGLYDAYACPRTQFLKVNGLLKLSFAPHLLDVQSTESITVGFVKAEQSGKGKVAKDVKPPVTNANAQAIQQMKEELREWILFEPLTELIKSTNIMYFPSVFEITSATNIAFNRITKGGPVRHLDILAPKTAPLYLQLDGPETNTLRISLAMLHPRVLRNSGILLVDYVEPAYVLIERFEWFKDTELPRCKSFVSTCGYDAAQLSFEPGRHFCRIWVHSRMNWHILLLSESSLVLGSRDQIQCAAVHECPWISKFLFNLSSAFTSWLRISRSSTTLSTNVMSDREFFRSYYPDLTWDNEVVGYDRSLLHWMFRQALQVHLTKRLSAAEQAVVYPVMRKYFLDPDFGFPPKPKPPVISLRTLAEQDPCDCEIPVLEEVEMSEEQIEEAGEHVEEKEIVCKEVMDKLLKPPVPPIASNICELATEEVPCGLMKEEREKVIRRHEAATVLQAYWRGTWARKCLNEPALITTDFLKVLQDSTLGNQDSLSSLMNEFFILYPGAKYAYSVASGLSGITGLNQHYGTSPVTQKCKWIPYFQVVFYCHTPCKVHFDLNSSIPTCTVAVYNCDTGEKLPQAFNAHKTFDFAPNLYGYTVTGHGNLNETAGINFDVHWQLTVLCSINGAFHICDNEQPCIELPLTPASKLHIDEIFIPNRRNILGGIQLSVTQHESVCFRVAATAPDLEMEAKLRVLLPNGESEELGSCSGVGEIFWPYLRLEPATGKEKSEVKIAPKLSMLSSRSVSKSNKGKPALKGSKSSSKLKNVPIEPRRYSILVVAPNGWPLTVDQWKRVDEVRNSIETPKIETPKPVVPKPLPGRPSVGAPKDKPKPAVPQAPLYTPLPGDAYVELECSLSVGRGITAVRDDDREVQFVNARILWEASEPGRNKRGAELRKEFRDEFLEVPAPPPSETPFSTVNLSEFLEFASEHLEEEKKSEQRLQGPTPVTEDISVEMSVESEEEARYLMMPEQLRDKFKPLTFLPLCTKELEEDGCVVITPNMAEAARNDRNARIQSAIDRMKELQLYNELHVLGRQKDRCLLTEKLFVDATWPPELQQVLEERDEAIVLETQMRILSANKKKQEQHQQTKPKK